VANCANPRFAGNLGADSGSPTDPLAAVQSLAGAGGNDNAAASGAASAANAATAAAQNSAASGTGKPGAIKAVGGGSTDFRNAAPVAYTRPGLPGTSSLPLLAFLAVLAVPPIVVGVRRLRRRDATSPPPN
jgi:hypothetical protein